MKNVLSAGLGFWDGAGFLFKGLKFVYKDHRSLARYYLAPLVIAFIVVGLGWFFLGMYASDIVSLIWDEPTENKWWGIAHVLWQVVNVLVWVVLAVVTAVLTFFMFSLLAAPFNDVLSESVEGILGTFEPKPFSWKFLMADLGRSIQIELKKIGVKILWLGPLFLLSLIIPVVGQILYVVVGGFIMSRLIGLEYMDWPMARREWPAQDRMDALKQCKWPILGFGSVIFLSLMLPMAFVVIWPGAVAGGTLLFVHIFNNKDANLVE